MRRKMTSGLMLTLFTVGLLTYASYVQPVESEPGEIKVPKDYPTIQEAVNAANTGDTIHVEVGTYENVILNKSVTLIGQDRTNTKIDGGGTKNSVLIEADECTVRGFTLQNGRPGGINVRSNRNLIENNIISGNKDDGMWLSGSTGNTVRNNIFTLNRATDIAVASSSHNIITMNTMQNSETGMGLYLYNSTFNNVTHNPISHNRGGIWLQYASHDNNIIGNTIEHTEQYDLNGELAGGQGILLNVSNGNNIYNNSFIENYIQVWSNNSINYWNDGYPSGGNFWSDHRLVDGYSGPNQNHPGSDEIADTAYVIDGNNKDNYPKMGPSTAKLTVQTFTVEGANIENVKVWIDGPQPTYYSPANVTVGQGSHEVEVQSPIYRQGYRYFFQYWEDGNRSNPINVTVTTDTTVTAYYDENSPPEAPFLTGPSEGYVFQEYTYTANTTDPNEDNIRYEFDWNDGSTTVVPEPPDYLPSGTEASASHNWSRPITYQLKVRAQDIHGEWGNYSTPFEVSFTQNDANKETDAGNSFATATDINPGSYKGTLYESNPTDTDDYYQSPCKAATKYT